MQRAAILTLGLLLTGFAGVQPSYSTSAQAGGEWTTLFDGKTLKGWDVVGDANWEVADGVIQANKGTGFLVTPVPYRDFQITVEFWVTDDANSGIFIRCSDPQDDLGDQRLRSEHLRQAARSELPDRRHRRCGEAVQCHQHRRQVEYLRHHREGTEDDRHPQRHEGRRRAEDTKHPDGRVALQYGAGTVKFRNVRIRRL